MSRECGVGTWLGVGLLIGILCVVIIPGNVIAFPDDKQDVRSKPVSKPNRATIAFDATVGVSASRADNNTTIHHENPDRVNREGNLGDITGWLSNRLTDRLTENAIHLSQGEYEAASNVLGEKYREQLGKYVDVAGETGETADDRAGEEFKRAHEQQQNFTKTVQQYNETYEKYQRAKQRGNLTRARQLARRLNRLAERANQTSTALQNTYRKLSNTTGISFTTASQLTQNITNQISSQQETIEETLFTPTQVSASIASSRISFLDPAVVVGQLTTVNGTPLANRTIQLRVPSRNVWATTNDSGHFRLHYRPTTLPLDTSRLKVHYRPRNTSLYLGSTTTVPVQVIQVQPTITITNHTPSAGYGDQFTVTARMTVLKQGVPKVPLQVFVGQQLLDTAQTSSTGRLGFSGTVPASITLGNRDLQIVFGTRGQALAPVNATTTVTIVETETRLTVTGRQADGRQLNVAGTFRTASGTPIPDQPIRIQVNGSIVETLRTNSTGAYADTVAISSVVNTNSSANMTLVVTATFDGVGTNLESARAETAVRFALVSTDRDNEGSENSIIEPDDSSRISESIRAVSESIQSASIEGLSSVPIWLWGVGGYVLVVLLTITGYRLWARSPSESRDAITQPSSEDDRVETTSEEHQPLLRAANERLSAADTDLAVQLGYHLLRSQFESTEWSSPELTHWEFYRKCRSAGLSPEQVDAVRRVTEEYERAAFASQHLSRETAREVLALVEDFINLSPEPNSDVN